MRQTIVEEEKVSDYAFYLEMSKIEHLNDNKALKELLKLAEEALKKKGDKDAF